MISFLPALAVLTCWRKLWEFLGDNCFNHSASRLVIMSSSSRGKSLLTRGVTGNSQVLGALEKSSCLIEFLNIAFLFCLLFWKQNYIKLYRLVIDCLRMILEALIDYLKHDIWSHVSSSFQSNEELLYPDIFTAPNGGVAYVPGDCHRSCPMSHVPCLRCWLHFFFRCVAGQRAGAALFWAKSSWTQPR